MIESVIIVHCGLIAPMNYIIDGIFISGITSIRRQQRVKEEGVTAIVRLDSGTERDECWSADDFTVLHEPFNDCAAIPADLIPKITRFIHEQIQNNGAVLVHCTMGISRSTAAVMAYLIEYHGMSLEQALATIRAGRKQAYPHRALVASLIRHYRLPYHPDFGGQLAQGA